MVKNKTEEEVSKKTATNNKPYTEDAHEFLKILGKWVYLRSTNPSQYDKYHEETRKWLESFKSKK